MLVLTVYEQTRVRIRVPGGPDVWVTLVQTSRAKAKLGFEAPRDVQIHREVVALRCDAAEQAEQPKAVPHAQG